MCLLRYTIFPCYLKVESFCETFLKPKWCKVKIQLPLIYMEKNFEHSEAQKLTYKITRSSQDLPPFNYNLFCLGEDRIMYFILDEQIKSLIFGGCQI